MKLKLKAAALTLALAAVATPALAQTTGTIKFTEGGSVNYTPPGHSATTIGPYEAQVISDPGQPTIDVFCVDFAHTVTVGDTYGVTFSSLTGDLSATRAILNGASQEAARQMYQKAAYLSTLFAGASNSDYDAISTAMWKIFDSSVPVASSANNWTYYSNLANANYLDAGIDYSMYSVITDLGAANGGHQELIGLYSTTVTPEPATYLLMASGLAGLAGLSYRRRRARQDSI